jgi:3-methyladenine DNA glycosylase AlkD
MNVVDVVEQLKAKANTGNLEGMSRYGMTVSGRLGVAVPEMRRIAKAAGKDHELALGLWQTGIAEARIVAAMVAVPARLTEEQMEDWVKDLDSWDVCDQVCMNLFDKSPLAWRKVVEWSTRDEEFVKRAAFALLACLAWHDRKAPDEEFIGLMPAIEAGSTDDRNFVKKAVNWALRSIGKRNPRLNGVAVEIAHRIAGLDSKAARWIAADALRELQSEAVQGRLAATTGDAPRRGSDRNSEP